MVIRNSATHIAEDFTEQSGREQPATLSVLAKFIDQSWCPSRRNGTDVTAKLRSAYQALGGMKGGSLVSFMIAPRRTDAAHGRARGAASAALACGRMILLRVGTSADHATKERTTHVD